MKDREGAKSQASYVVIYVQPSASAEGCIMANNAFTITKDVTTEPQALCPEEGDRLPDEKYSHKYWTTLMIPHGHKLSASPFRDFLHLHLVLENFGSAKVLR